MSKSTMNYLITIYEQLFLIFSLFAALIAQLAIKLDFINHRSKCLIIVILLVMSSRLGRGKGVIFVIFSYLIFNWF